MNIAARFTHWFAGLRIGVRLTLAFATVLMLTALLGGASVFNLTQVNRASSNLADKWLPSVGYTSAVRALILEYRELEVKHARAADDSYRTEYEDKMKEIGAAVSAKLADYGKLEADEDERKLAQAFSAKWAEYQGFAKKVTDLGRAGKADDAKDIGDGASKMAADEAIGALPL